MWTIFVTFTVHGDINIYCSWFRNPWKNNKQPWMKMYLLSKTRWCRHFDILVYWRVDKDHFWEFPIEECHITTGLLESSIKSSDRVSHVFLQVLIFSNFFLVAKKTKANRVEVDPVSPSSKKCWKCRHFDFPNAKNWQFGVMSSGSWLASHPVMVVEIGNLMFQQRWNFLDVPGRKWMDQGLGSMG